jgi:hypothetical protein
LHSNVHESLFLYAEILFSWTWHSGVIGTAVFTHSSVIDIAVHIIGNFIVEYLRKFEAMFKKALTCVSGAKEELFDEKNQRSKILCQGHFKLVLVLANHISTSTVIMIMLQPIYIINILH